MLQFSWMIGLIFEQRQSRKLQATAGTLKRQEAFCQIDRQSLNVGCVTLAMRHSLQQHGLGSANLTYK
ncbi:hypothetical protein [Leptodesmis sp.]|uniref:hypothetical protein n=1 Tax=Leptodesmis sp. TaxID=3100501 RepID=UPI0040534CAA